MKNPLDENRNRSLFRAIHNDRYCHAMLGATALQQALVASSIYLLAIAAQAAAGNHGDRALLFFVFYLGALVVPYGPGVLAQYFWRLWRARIVRTMHEDIVTRTKPSPPSFSQTALGEDRTAIFANGLPNALNQAVDFSYDFAQTLMNSLFAMIAIALVIDPLIGAAYLASLILCGFYIKLFYKKSAQAAEATENRRVALTAVAHRYWPNTILGNVHSRGAWLNRLRRNHDNHIDSVRRESMVRFLSNGALSLATLTPLVVTAGFLAFANKSDHLYLAALMVTMPRIFYTLSLVSHVMFLIFDFSQTAGKLNVVQKLFEVAPDRGTIDFSRMRIEVDNRRRPFNSVEAFAAVCLVSRRIRIRGENGSGKSSLLLAAKELLGDRAFYLPPSSLIDFDAEPAAGSTGQRKNFELRSLLACPPCPVLLLDEWDANLDSGNIDAFEHELEFARGKGITIAEIRHR